LAAHYRRAKSRKRRREDSRGGERFGAVKAFWREFDARPKMEANVDKRNALIGKRLLTLAFIF